MSASSPTLSQLPITKIHSAVRHMDNDTARLLLEKVGELDVEILQQPETGLVMMNVFDCFQTEFHLGEILATRAVVTINHCKGWGMIMGDTGDKALLLACLDALQKLEETPLHRELVYDLTYWLDKSLNEQTDQLKRAAATRVSFESMANE